MLTHENKGQYSSPRVVVLGAGGVVGRWLCAHLEAAGQPYLGLDRAAIDLTSGDAGDRLVQLLRDGDSLVFLSTVTPARGRGLSAMQANLAMMHPVLAAIRSGKLGHLVYLSSDAVYGRYDQLISETSYAEPGDPHGAMHRAREILLSEFSHTAIIRATLLYGFGDTHNSYGPNRFLTSARSESVIRLFGDGEETRDHLFLGDLVSIISTAVARRSTGVVNAASGQSISYGDLAKLIVSFAPGTKIERLPRSGPITHRHFDTSILIQAFPELQTTRLEDGLRVTMQRYGETNR